MGATRMIVPQPLESFRAGSPNAVALLKESKHVFPGAWLGNCALNLSRPSSRSTPICGVPSRVTSQRSSAGMNDARNAGHSLLTSSKDSAAVTFQHEQRHLGIVGPIALLGVGNVQPDGPVTPYLLQRLELQRPSNGLRVHAGRARRSNQLQVPGQGQRNALVPPARCAFCESNASDVPL